MAQGRRKAERQEPLWVAMTDIPAAAHPFYSKVNEVFDKHGFDRYVDGLTAPLYKDGGRPGIPVGNYFRMMMIGFFEDIGSERGIAWRVADSFSLRHFLGLGLADATPDHSSLSIIRRRLPEDVHQRVFQFILTVLAREGQLRGKTLGIDATTVEASAALRELQRKDTKERYGKYVKRLAEEAGEAASTKEEVARFDRKRKGKKLSNEDWEHPHDPDARIGRDKHNATDMLYKLEKADDLETGAIVSVTVQTADTGDTASVDATILAAMENVAVVLEDEQAIQPASEAVGEAGVDPELSEGGKVFRVETADPVSEVVGDKGYHSNETCRFYAEIEVRTYFSEPERGVRRWEGKEDERKAVCGNRRRIRGGRGKRLLRLRGEHCERNFAHLCDTGGQRRTFLRGLANVTKKALIGAMGFNVGLLLRKVFGLRKPRQLRAGGSSNLPFHGPVFVSLWPGCPVWVDRADVCPVFAPLSCPRELTHEIPAAA